MCATSSPTPVVVRCPSVGVEILFYQTECTTSSTSIAGALNGFSKIVANSGLEIVWGCWFLASTYSIRTVYHSPQSSLGLPRAILQAPGGLFYQCYSIPMENISRINLLSHIPEHVFIKPVSKDDITCALEPLQIVDNFASEEL